MVTLLQTAKQNLLMRIQTGSNADEAAKLAQAYEQLVAAEGNEQYMRQQAAHFERQQHGALSDNFLDLKDGNN